MPTFYLSLPYENIFGIASSYSKLKIFRCLCYPWLRPYASYKLDTRSDLCVLIGYSLTQSAYYCLNPVTLKLYISQHVKFIESVFPFNLISNQAIYPQPDTTTTWIPPLIKLFMPSLVPPLNI